MDRKFNKIVCVGLPKTGTTTLGQCLEILGYSKAGYDIDLIERVAGGKTYDLSDTLAQFDCFEDWPYPLIYKEIYSIEPDTAFILTTRRNANIWIESIQKHTKRNPSPRSKLLRDAFYGHDDPMESEEEYRDFYEKHNAEVAHFFDNKSDQLMTLCWEDGDGWDELCTFLSDDKPAVNLPHANSARSREGLLYRIKRKIKQLMLPSI